MPHPSEQRGGGADASDIYASHVLSNAQIRLNIAPMCNRDNKLAAAAHSTPPHQLKQFTVSNVSARDAIVTQKTGRGENVIVEIMTGEKNQNSTSLASRVLPIMLEKLKEPSEPVLSANIHLMFDYDGVLHLKELNNTNLCKLESKNESKEQFQRTLQRKEKTEEEMNELLSIFDEKQKYFQDGQPMSAANLKAANYSAYNPDEFKIARILNAILNEDYDGRVHILVDDREDILTAVFNFFHQYAYLFKGKLILYKTEELDRIDKDLEKTISAGTASRCEWSLTDDPRTKKKIYALNSKTYARPVATMQGFLGTNGTIQEDEIIHCKANDIIHAKWGKYLAHQISQDAHNFISDPDTHAYEEKSDETNHCCIQGNATVSIGFQKQHELVSILNNTFTKAVESKPETNIEATGKSSEMEKAAYVLNEFNLEIQAAHFQMRKNQSVKHMLPKNRGKTIPLAALVASKISSIVGEDPKRSPDDMMRGLLEHFSCEELSPEFIDSLVTPTLEDPHANAAASSSKPLSKSNSRRAVTSTTTEDQTDDNSQAIEMPSVTDQATTPTASELCFLLPLADISKSHITYDYEGLTKWLASLGIHTKVIQVMSNDRFSNLETAALSILQESHLKTQSDNSQTLIFLPFGIDDDDLYNQIYHQSNEGQPFATIVAPQRREDQDAPIHYFTSAHNRKKMDLNITEIPVDTSAPSTLPWRAGVLGINVVTGLATAVHKNKIGYIETSLPKDKSLGTSIVHAHWMTRVARALLPSYATFSQSEISRTFFTNLAATLKLNMADLNEKNETAQSIWLMLLQALATGWGESRLFVIIPDKHEVIWYEKLLAYCEHFLFIKPSAQGIERGYNEIDRQTVMIKTHHELIRLPSETSTAQHRTNPIHISSPSTQALIARFVEHNNSLETKARLVTTLEKIAKFIKEMVNELPFILERDDHEKAMTFYIEALGTALIQLCDLPIKDERHLAPLKENDRVSYNLTRSIFLLIPLLSLKNLSADSDAPPPLMRCLKLIQSHCKKLTSSLEPMFNYLKHMKDLEEFPLTLSSFLSTTLSTIPLLAPHLNRYTQPTTMPNILKTKKETQGEQVKNPYPLETTIDLLAQLVEDISAGNPENQEILVHIFLMLFYLPCNPNNNQEMREPALLILPITGDDIADFCEKLLTQLNPKITRQSLSQFYQILQRYDYEGNRSCEQITKPLAASFRHPNLTFMFLLNQTLSSGDDTQPEDRHAAEAATANQPPKDTKWSKRPSSTIQICSADTFKQYFNILSSYFYNDSRQERRPLMEAGSTLIPLTAGALGLAILLQMPPNNSTNGTYSNITTVSPGESSISQFNLPITIGWVTLMAFVTIARTLAATKVYPKPENEKPAWTNATKMTAFILAVTPMITMLTFAVATDQHDVSANPDTYYLGNLTISIGKGHAGSSMLVHAIPLSDLFGKGLLALSNALFAACCSKKSAASLCGNISQRSAQTISLMVFLSSGWLLAINPLASALLTFGINSNGNATLPLVATANFLNAVIATTCATFGSLGAGLNYLRSSYTLTLPYQLVMSFLLLLGVGVTLTNIADFTEDLIEFETASNSSIPPAIEIVVDYSSEFIYGDAALMALFVVIITSLAESNRKEKSPSRNPREVTCCSSRLTNQNNQKRQTEAGAPLLYSPTYGEK